MGVTNRRKTVAASHIVIQSIMARGFHGEITKTPAIAAAVAIPIPAIPAEKSDIPQGPIAIAVAHPPATSNADATTAHISTAVGMATLRSDMDAVEVIRGGDASSGWTRLVPVIGVVGIVPVIAFGLGGL